MAERKNYREETLEKFEKFLKGEELNLEIYKIDYCPDCNEARIVHFYSPDSWDDYCSVQNRREMMRFEPCGHDMSQNRWKPIINWPKKAREQYRVMKTPVYQLKIFREKMNELKNSEIKQHRESVKKLNECLKRAAKIKRSLMK